MQAGLATEFSFGKSLENEEVLWRRVANPAHAWLCCVVSCTASRAFAGVILLPSLLKDEVRCPSMEVNLLMVSHR